MKKAMLTLAVFLLPGCSAGPNEGDVKAAFSTAMAASMSLVGESTFQDLEVGECKEMADRPGYACSLSGKVSIKTGIGDRSVSQALSGTFVFEEIGGEWRMTGAM